MSPQPNPLVSGQKDIPIVRSGGAGYNQTNGPLPGPTVAGAAGVTEQPSQSPRPSNTQPSSSPTPSQSTSPSAPDPEPSTSPPG